MTHVIEYIIKAFSLVGILGIAFFVYKQMNAVEPSLIHSDASNVINTSNVPLNQQVTDSKMEEKLEKISKHLISLSETLPKIQKRLDDLEFGYINVIESELLTDSKGDNRKNTNTESEMNEIDQQYELNQSQLDNVIANADQSFSSNHIDKDFTERTQRNLSQAIEKLNNVSISSILCDDSVCRAELYQHDGKEIEIDKLIGLPPFDGTTISKPGKNGVTTYYFTKKGQSLSEMEMGES